MRILAVETSCDETGVAVLEVKGCLPAGRQGFRAPKIKILSNIVASQVKVHAPWGGVVPNLAKREHQRNLPIILKKALREAGLISKSKFLISKQIKNLKLKIKNSIKIPKIDLIAVTSGPGLEPCLWTGINFSQELAKKWKKPLIGINHLEGHIFSVFLKNRKEFSISPPDFAWTKSRRAGNFQFPILALIVSGGHTELVLINPPAGGGWKYRVIGQTLDDAAGEAFDKVARLLGLGYPGGPAIAAEAAKIRNPKSEILNKSQILNPKFQIKLPRPMINSKDYNFSFSGLKTAVLYLVRDLEKKVLNSCDRRNLVPFICKEFQQAVIDVLIKKTIRAAEEYKVKTVILGGGVVANKELRRQFQEIANKRSSGYMLNLLMPEMEFTGDNAAMIALAAYFRAPKYKKSAFSRTLKVNGNLKLN